MKHKKSALFKSLISLLLCFSMLMGTTFAWFTDSVMTGINTIAAGNLDVELFHSNAAVSNEQVDSNTKLFMDLQGNPILWEPGVVSYENLRITNEGDLALAYQLAINTANENFVVDGSNLYGLSQVLKVGVVEGGITATDRAGVVASVEDANWTTLANFLRSGSLLPEGKGESEKTWGVVIYWEPGENDNLWNLNNGKQLSEDDVLQIDLGVKLVATQEQFENDSFGSDYDETAKQDVFPEFSGGTASIPVTPNAENKTGTEVTVSAGQVSAVVPAGVLLAPGTTQLTLAVTLMDASGANISLSDNEAMRSLDVHIEGVDPANTTPIIVTLKEAAPTGLNMGNYKLYHVENGSTNEMTLVDSAADFTAHNQFKYDPATGDIVLYMATFSEVTVVADLVKAWEGGVDHSWYKADEDVLTIANADQLWSFSQIVGGMAKDEGGNAIEQNSFSEKIVKLVSDINLGDSEAENNPNLIFYPIGYYNSEGTYEKTNTAITSDLRNFKGTFDGQGHTIANFYQNTWEMKGDHDWYSPEEQYYRDGMGLFGRVYGGTVKNLTVSNFSSDGEIATTGCIAAYADGATFENIAIFNCNPRVYNIGNGGIVGCVGWYAKDAGLKTTFTNITVDNSNKISALWGSYDVACGGIVGQYYPTSGQTSAGTPKNAGVHFENCHVSAIMDVYNDVCANYQYYAYRYTGMLIGSVRENETINGHSYPKMDGISAENCTVHFGTWNDYYYCELVDNTTASYTHDYQMSRLVEIKAIDGTSITYLDGTTGTVPASGRANYVIVDYTKGHGTNNATCYHFKDGAVWTHDMGGIQTGIDENGDGKDDLKEDKQHLYLEFNNLVTGYGWGVTSRGFANLDGVTNLDITQGNQEASVEKFEKKLTAEDAALEAGREYKVGDLFTAIDENKINDAAVQVAVTAVNDSGITAEYVASTTGNWEDGTLTFNKIEGVCSVTIQDYNFCKPTTIILKDGKLHDLQKFNIVFPNVDTYLYRVGNMNEIALSSLFAEEGVVVDKNVNITITGVEGFTYTANSTEWEKGTIHFNNKTGLAQITIDEAGVGAKTLNVEVVDAKNYPSPTTGASLNATANNVVLLSNCGFSAVDVSGGYSLYGNGFTLTASSDSAAKQMSYGFIDLNNGKLDNVQVICPNFSHAILYDSNKSESNNKTDGEGRYYNIRSAVLMTGNSTIANSYISGGRAAVYISSGVATIDNSTIVGGAAANIDISLVNSVLLRDVTLIQKPFKATVNDTSKTLMGFSGVVTCAADGSTADIRLEGELKQYAWIDEYDAQYVPSSATPIVESALKKTDFLHDLDKDGTKESLNLGFVFIPATQGGAIEPTIKENDNRTNKGAIPYDYAVISSSLAGATVYSYINTSGTVDDYLTEPGYSPNNQTSTLPAVSYGGPLEGCEFNSAYDENSGWNSTLTVDLDTLGSYTFSFDNLVATKYGQNLEYAVTNANGNDVDVEAPVNLTSSSVNKYTLSIIDDLQFDANGNKVENAEVIHKYSFTLIATMSSINPPELTILSAAALPIATNYMNDDWTCAVPALENITVTYWSTTEKKYKENVTLDSLIDWEGIEIGKQSTSGTNNNVWTYEGADFTLEITGGTVKSDPAVYTVPVVVTKDSAKQLYFVASNSTDGMVSNGTSARSTNLTYKFTDKNQTHDSDSRSWTVNYATDVENKTQYNYDSFCKGELIAVTATKPTACLAEGTQITLADGTKKAVEDLRKGDMVMSFDHVTGNLTKSKVIIVVKTAEDNYFKNTFVFDDGTELVTINEHGIFDLDLNKYVNIDHENYRDFIGHRFVSVDTEGNLGVKKLETVETVRESGYKYDIVTDQTLNYVAEDTLSVTHVLVNIIDTFDFGVDLKYDAKKMQADIEKYGLYTYNEWEAYCDIAVFEQYNIPVMRVGISKGMYTKAYIISLINKYVLNENVQITD